jgi:hypothetical protein
MDNIEFDVWKPIFHVTGHIHLLPFIYYCFISYKLTTCIAKRSFSHNKESKMYLP